MNVNMITVDFAIKMYSLANKLKHSFIFPHTRPSGNTATIVFVGLCVLYL